MGEEVLILPLPQKNICFNFHLYVHVCGPSGDFVCAYIPSNSFSPFAFLSRDLLKLVSSKLGPFVGQGAAYAEPKGSDKEILDLLNFFQDSSSQVSYLRVFEIILL
jgi:hypothetical protein